MSNVNDKDKIERMGSDKNLKKLSEGFFNESYKYNYSYNFSWMGRPIIQYPQDILAVQEIIWTIKPDLIIETGVAHGGSIIFYASMLELLGGEGRVLGIDVDIRTHNRKAIEEHPMFKRIELLEGSSTDQKTVDAASQMSKSANRTLVILDSNHTHEHVLEELRLYSPLVGQGSYLIVFDTIVEDMPQDSFPDRPWGKGNNPKTAVWEFLKSNDRFEIDTLFDQKLLLSAAPQGYLKCVKD